MNSGGWNIPAKEFIVVLRKDDGENAEIVSGVGRKTQRLMTFQLTTDTA